MAIDSSSKQNQNEHLFYVFFFIVYCTQYICLQEGDIELEVVFVTPDEDSDDDAEVVGVVDGKELVKILLIFMYSTKK